MNDEGEKGWSIDGVQTLMWQLLTHRVLPAAGALVIVLAVVVWALFF